MDKHTWTHAITRIHTYTQTQIYPKATANKIGGNIAWDGVEKSCRATPFNKPMFFCAVSNKTEIISLSLCVFSLKSKWISNLLIALYFYNEHIEKNSALTIYCLYKIECLLIFDIFSLVFRNINVLIGSTSRNFFFHVERS